jgi:hypothetical protein
MELVEVYRLRRWAIGWAAALIVLAVPLALTIGHTTVDVNGTTLIEGIRLPFEVVAPLAMIFAMAFATFAGLSLNRENETRALSWTKPLSRTAVGLRLMAVDLGALVAMFVLALVVALAVAATAHVTLSPSTELGSLLALSLGIVVMWYALTELLTAPLARPAGAVAGLLWVAALILLALDGKIGGALAPVIALLNVANPLAYLTGGLPYADRAAIVWALALVFGALALAIWSRREA